MKITFTVPGKPQGKGRPRFTRSGSPYTPKKTTEYEGLIRRMYLMQGGKKFSGAVKLSVLILYPIPKSTTKKERMLMIEGSILPMKTPDGDNVEKAVADALNKVAYDDDSQIIEAKWQKIYAADDEHIGLVVTLSEPVETYDGWISVKDMLPPYDQLVLVVNEDGCMHTAIRKKESINYDDWQMKFGIYPCDNDVWIESESGEITHWRPLPELPQVRGL